MMNSDSSADVSRRQFVGAGMALGAMGGPLGEQARAAPANSAAKAFTGIIDVHAHATAPSWMAWLQSRSAEKAPLVEGMPVPAWSEELAIEVMDEHGIRAMILSNPVGTKGMTRDEAVRLARAMNEEIAATLTRHPQRFGAFAVLPLQDTDAALAEMAFALDTLGFDGVCLPTSFEGTYPGDSRYEPVLAELNRRKATAFVHPHSPPYAGEIAIRVLPGVVEYVFDSTRALVSLVASGMRRRYPDFNYIASHGGGTLPFVADRVAFMGSAASSYGVRLSPEEIMAVLKGIHYDLAFATSGPALAALRAFLPIEQLVPGFDFPYAPRQVIGLSNARLVSSGLFTESELATIATRNPIKLLPGFSARIGSQGK